MDTLSTSTDPWFRRIFLQRNSLNWGLYRSPPDITLSETTMALLNKAPSLQSGVQRKLGRRRQHVVCQASEQHEPKPLLNIRNSLAAGVASVVSLGTCARVYASTQASKPPLCPLVSNNYAANKILHLAWRTVWLLSACRVLTATLLWHFTFPTGACWQRPVWRRFGQCYIFDSSAERTGGRAGSHRARASRCAAKPGCLALG